MTDRTLPPWLRALGTILSWVLYALAAVLLLLFPE